MTRESRCTTSTPGSTKSPESIKRMTEMGNSIIAGTPGQMAEINKVETARWGPIVKAPGAKDN